MEETSGITFDEEGYCSVTLEDIATVLPLSRPSDDAAEVQDDDANVKTRLYPFSTGNIDLMHQLASNITLGNTPLRNMRRVVWGYFLGVYDAADVHTLVKDIDARRATYWDLVEAHRIDKIATIKSLDPQLFHPLAPVERNPWELSQRSRELLDEIWQDVERTYQERSLFTKDPVRKTLQRILYVWSKEHPYISYKQGMNELLAIIYIVCYRDQLREPDAQASQQYAKMFSTDEKDFEADAYTLFDALMSLEMQLMYDTAAANAPSMKSAAHHSVNLQRVASEAGQAKMEPRNSFIARTSYIYSSILKEYDSQLLSHLLNIGIEPHVFLMRWIRLIFSREFNVNETLNLWDTVFADHFLGKLAKKELPQYEFEMIDFFAVAMLTFVRENLLENDMTYCLQRLFKFPPIEDVSHLISKAQKIRAAYYNRTKSNKSNPEESPDSFRCSTGSEDEQEEHVSTGDQLVTHKHAKAPNGNQRSKKSGKSDKHNSSTDHGPKPVPTCETGSSVSLPRGQKDLSIPLQSLKTELKSLARRVHKIYEHPDMQNSEELVNEIQVVHSKLLHLMWALDS